jgi:hypothetical protein
MSENLTGIELLDCIHAVLKDSGPKITSMKYFLGSGQTREITTTFP